ncbi:pyrophosphate-energized membrane proton pump 2 [Quercus suber]|uniref:Pyrophosphate-energized membrane proton pump 2 n=1 Tax=Quercus suber TaxID=58331 RepID=A0AAW0KQU1_QUESU
MFVDNDVEGGNLGPYADRPRVFPSMRSKVHTPLIFWILMGINVRVLLILLLLGLGAIFYVGAKTSPIIVFVFSICIISFLFSIYLTKWVLTKDEGPSERVQVRHLLSVSSARDVICLFFCMFSRVAKWGYNCDLVCVLQEKAGVNVGLRKMDELGKHCRSSSFELGNNGEEPDLSWVQSLAKESSTYTKQKVATPVSIAASSSEGSNMNSQIELVGHAVSGAWVE